ncbi:MAG: phosphate/phosphite/phosphonate ABC transporter substrate-binding protein [Deltaproteobacteria bacterium]|nr:phosphate/phosphite/phosphonate ABC transporter substrate-binding protein [Deltaproteobacteria bacterium]
MEKWDGKRAAGAAVVLAAVLVLSMAGGSAIAAGQGPVRFGVTISESVDITLKKYQPLMDYLSRKVGRPFEVRPVKSYDDILALMKTGDADVGVLGSIAGSEAIRNGQAVPAARAEKGGVSTYRGYLIVRKDGGAKKVEDLRGKTFDSNGGSASVGKFFPRKLLKDRKLDFDTFFSRVTSSTKHDVVVYKVLDRQADCGTVKDSVFDKLAKSDERVKKEIVIMATSQPFPDGNVMFRKGAAADLEKATREALLGMDKVAEAKPALDALGADRFIPSPAKDYESVMRGIAALAKK